MSDPDRTVPWLPPDALAELDALGPRDVVVGLHGLNQARAVPASLAGWAAGLSGALASAKSALILADAGSRDGTVEAAVAGEAGARPALALRVPGIPHRGRAVLAILAAGLRLGARACVVADAGLVSVGPDWASRLAGPILDGAVECVLPCYDRAVTDGTLTTNVLAPAMRLLSGRSVQEVLGGCLGVSPGLLEHLLGLDGLAEDPAGPAVEMRLVLESLLARDAVGEAGLGRKRLDPGAVAGDVSQTVADVVGPLFGLMERHADSWQAARRAAPVRRLGAAPTIGAPAGDVSVERMVRAFRLGLKDLLPVWEQVMPEETLGRLYPLGLLDADEFAFPASFWAQVVGDFAVAYHDRRLPRDHLLRALTPLYLGRVAAFVHETQAGPPAGVPAIIERMGLAFEAERARLSARWR